LDAGDELVGMVDCPEGEVSLFTDFQGADLILEAEGAGGIDGGSAKTFGGSEAEQGAGHIEGEQEVG